MNEIEVHSLVLQILKKSKNRISSYLEIDDYQFEDVLSRFVVRTELSGHNNQICLVDFFDNKGNFLSGACVKYSLGEKMKSGLALEANILSLLSLNKKICPKLLDSGILEQDNVSYIITEIIRGTLTNHSDLSIEKASLVLDVVQLHEAVLLDNIQIWDTASTFNDLYKKTDFKKKVTTFLTGFVPGSVINDSLSFLNYYLNHERTISRRVIVTDRSVENIFQNQNGDIVMIDFSTIRVGTQFDNWIQFIDDPRITLSCKKEDLVNLFFKRNKLNTKDLKFFYAASVYTNLLHGIFTYEKNPRLGINYFKNANESFMKLKNKKSTLIDISH